VPGILSRYGVPLGDGWTDPATFQVGAVDKLDVQAIGADVVMQFYSAGGWLPQEPGMIVGRGLFRSIPGLSILFPPIGPTGFRFRNRIAGAAASVNFDAFQL
jgi:hypothetical protein